MKQPSQTKCLYLVIFVLSYMEELCHTSIKYIKIDLYKKV